jgi:hypothetical protein
MGKPRVKVPVGPTLHRSSGDVNGRVARRHAIREDRGRCRRAPASHSGVGYESVEIARDLDLLIAVVIAIAGVAGLLFVGNLFLRLPILIIALAVAAYVAGLIGPIHFSL